MTGNTGWMEGAECLDEDPELFFPIGNTGPALVQIEEAKEVCRRCDVIVSCLAWALDTGQDAGVWGGMSEDERRALKRRNARAHRAGGGAPMRTQPTRAGGGMGKTIDAALSRQIIDAATRAGMDLGTLARAAGVRIDVLHNIRRGQQQVTVATQTRLQGVQLVGAEPVGASS